MLYIYKTVFITLLTFSFVGCGGDNSYNGENGLIDPTSTSSTSLDTEINSLYQDVIKKDAQNAYVQSAFLLSAVEDLNNSADEAHLQSARDEFKKLILSYKRVESSYVAGYNSDDMRDIADFYIEQFIKGSKSQDIAGDLDQVFAGTKQIVVNSLKGITALEYTLFGDVESITDIKAKMNQNRLDAALLMAKNIKVQFLDIQDYYQNDTKFLSSNDDAISALLNVLVDNSFRLRESRIGDGAGFTEKYKDNPSNTRLEYYYSTYSLNAIIEILNTHNNIMENGLKAIAIEGNAASEADAITTAIDDALALCNAYSGSLESNLADTKTQELYDTAKTLQNNYTALINGLNFTQDIVEADGD